MDEIYHEHYPLLQEESPTEGKYAIRYHRRACSMSYRSRSRNNIRGAAAIITRWPDHWSNYLTYWWIGLGIMCLTTFIIYNSLFLFTIYPLANTIPTKLKISTTPNTPSKDSTSTHVYMHVVANNNTSVDLMEYLPLIEVITKNYTTFCYHFIIVLNDTLSRNEELSAEENNENALNLVLNEDITYTKKMAKTDSILIEQISLTKLMDDSPARKYWRLLSYQFIEFLIRASSIWEKGGIAFNPLVLKSQRSVLYTEKLKNILEAFQNKNKSEYIHNITKSPKNVDKDSKKFYKRVNNIRDIINVLENENNSNYSTGESLIQTENRNTMSMLPVSRKLFSVIESNITNENVQMKYERNPKINYKNNNAKRLYDKLSTKDSDMKETLRKNYNSSSNTLLPSFLDFLFHHSHGNPNTEMTPTKNIKLPTSDAFTNEYEASTKLGISNKSILNPNTKNRIEPKIVYPIVVPVNETGTQTNLLEVINISSTVNNDLNLITIDIKGNIIATQTRCHAFLGTMFNYAVHQKREEKLTDFIISQLSIFCKGVLSSCIGIDVILL